MLLILAFQVGCLILMGSDWKYELVDGKVKRAWAVLLPGYDEFLDLNQEPPAMTSVFSLRKQYRVSPWLDCEWTDEEPKDW